MRRAIRPAILVAILIALGAWAVERGSREWGVELFVAALAVAAAFIFLVYLPARVPRGGVLLIGLAGRIREYGPRLPFEQLAGRAAPTLHHLRRALTAAAGDRSIRAVIVEIAGAETGMASALEIHDLLCAIRARGKRVVAVLSGDNLSVREYLIAAGCGEIVTNPDTALMMLGVAAGNLFLKGALGKLKVEAQTLQWKEYKGAAETFTREAMSPELRESMEAVIADWRATLADKLATARKLERDAAQRLVGGGFMSATDACRAGLVDRTGYFEDVRNEFDPGDKGKTFVGLARYIRHLRYVRRPARARIALVYGVGPVVTGQPRPAGEFIHGGMVAELIERAARNRRVRAIVFRVASPGGSAVASDLVWRAVQEARSKGKPVVVSMGDVAGSGGYYVAMGADAIVAEPATLTGSIGVVYTKFSARGLLAELGINIDYAKSDEISDALTASRAMTEAELAQCNRLAGEVYATFTKKVAEGRKLDAERVEEVARGRIWSGLAARERGLVDELGGLGRAIAIAREKAGLKPTQRHELAVLPAPSPLAGLRLAWSGTQAGFGMELVADALGVPAEWTPALLGLLARGGAMLLSPFF